MTAMTCILRVNLDIVGSQIRKNPRFRTAVTSIRTVLSKYDRVVVLSHRGRPSPDSREPELSLKPLAALIQRELGHAIIFLDHFNFPMIRQEIDRSPSGSIFLLENMRYLPGETKNDPGLGKQLASLGDRFINDDFASSHRANASLEAITKFIPSSLGTQLEHELSHLRSIVQLKEKPFILVIGGVKLEEKLGILKRFLPEADAILLGGVPANTVLKARGADINGSLYDDRLITKLNEVVKSQKVIVPEDFRREKHVIYDIGPETIKRYTSIIGGAKRIIWSGPMGLIEKRRFTKGTRGIAKAVLSNRSAKTVIGGGDTLSAIPLRLAKNNPDVLISTGGGATLTFLAGEPLPALEAINHSE